MKTEKEYIELLRQYRERPLSKGELQELLEWLDTTEGEEACARYMDTLMFETSIQKGVDQDVIYHRIMNRIKRKLVFHSLARYRKTWLGAAATVLLLIVGGGITYFTQTKHPSRVPDEVTFRVDRGNKAMLTLADGSKVWLNSESVLRWSEDNVRDVALEGEAYFEVAKDKKHSFEVHTSYGTIRVYGTSFNVKAHSRDSLFAVALVEGSVGLQMNHLKKEVKLRPNEKICYNQKDHTLRLTGGSMADAGIWREQELKLTDVTIPVLWDKMGHWYGRKFVVKNMPKKNHLYNVTIQTESVEKMLELIGAITPIEYVIKEKEVTIVYK